MKTKRNLTKITKAKFEELNEKIITTFKPSFATTSVVITEKDNVYIKPEVNSDYYYQAKSIQDVIDVIFTYKRNVGWVVMEKGETQRKLSLLLNELKYENVFGENGKSYGQGILENDQDCEHYGCWYESELNDD